MNDDYLARRARAEMEMAQKASFVEAAHAHTSLAEAYLGRSAEPETAHADLLNDARRFSTRRSLAQE